MKKVLAILAIAAFAVSFTACKKDYTCSCTYDSGTGVNTTLDFEYKKVKKDVAEDSCSELDDFYKLIDANASCSI